MTYEREVYDMVTEQKPPEPGALERQHTRQVRTARNRKVGALVAAAAIAAIALIVLIPNLGGGTEPTPAATGSTGSVGEPMQAVPDVEGQPLTPGRYAISTLSPMDESYEVTIDIPEGFSSGGPSFIMSDEGAVSVWGVGWVFDDACQWKGTATETASTDDVVAALMGERGLQVSTPTAITVDGYPGTYVEVTVASKAALDRCDGKHFGAFALAGDDATGMRHLEGVGEPEMLWIVDVDGNPLVIDGWGTEPGRAEVERMVSTIQIDPVE